MSAQVSERFVGSFTRGDIEHALENLHPECVFHESGDLPYPGDFHGKRGFLEIAEGINKRFEVTFESYEVFDVGETGIVRIRLEFVSRTTQRRLRTSIVEVHTYQDGLIVEGDVYYKDPAGLRDLASE